MVPWYRYFPSSRFKNVEMCIRDRPQVGVVAVNPNLIPYGSKLYITSADGSYVYGYAIAGDTGGGVMKGTLIADLYMDTYEECIQFGKRRNFKVFVLE